MKRQQKGKKKLSPSSLNYLQIQIGGDDYDGSTITREVDSVFNLNIIVLDRVTKEINTDFSGDITIYVSQGTSNLTGTLTESASGGIATFAGLSFDATGDYTINVKAQGTFSGTVSFEVTDVTANSLSISGLQATAGTSKIFSFVVNIVDGQGVIDTSATDSITLAKDSGSGTLAGTLTKAAVNGVATFDDVYLDAADDYVLSVSADGLTGDTGSITIVNRTITLSSTASNYDIDEGFIVNAYIYNNGLLDTSYSGNLVIAKDSGTGTLSGTTTRAVSNGIASFTGMSIDTAGPYVLSVNGNLCDESLINISINAAPPVLVFDNLPNSANVGGTITTFTVTAKDALGDTDTSFTDDVTVAISIGTGSLTGTTTKAAVSGVATFNDLSIDTAGQFTLEATGVGVDTGTGTITIISAVTLLNHNGGFETGDTTYWRADVGSNDSSDAQIDVVTTNPREGTYCIRLQHQYVGPKFNRVEISSNENYGGTQVSKLPWHTEFWMGWSFYLDGWLNNVSNWNVIGQTHGIPYNYDWTCGSSIGLFEITVINNDFWIICQTIDTPYQLNPPNNPEYFLPGYYSRPLSEVDSKWVDIVTNFIVSPDNDGFFRFWMNTNKDTPDWQLVHEGYGPNTYAYDGCNRDRSNPGEVNFQVGSYKPTSNTEFRRVYYDAFRIAGADGNFSAVAPGQSIVLANPTFQSGEVGNIDSNTVEVTFTESLQTGNTDGTIGLTGSTTGTFTVGTLSIVGGKLRFPITETPTSSETLVLAYTNSGSNPLQTSDGREVQTFTGKSISNNISGLTVQSTYASSNQDAAANLHVAENTYRAQGFTATANGTLSKCSFYLQRVGTVTGNDYALLYASTGTMGTNATPTGAPLATSDALPASGIDNTGFADTEITFSGANKVAITSGTDYFIAFKDTISIDASNRIDLGTDSSSPTHPGNSARSTDGSSWSTLTSDIIFTVWTE